MAETDWEGVERALMSLTVVRLRRLARSHFGCCLGGASTKGAMAHEMVSQMRHWWRNCGIDGQVRARTVLYELSVEVEEK